MKVAKKQSESTIKIKSSEIYLPRLRRKKVVEHDVDLAAQFRARLKSFLSHEQGKTIQQGKNIMYKQKKKCSVLNDLQHNASMDVLNSKYCVPMTVSYNAPKKVVRLKNLQTKPQTSEQPAHPLIRSSSTSAYLKYKENAVRKCNNLCDISCYASFNGGFWN